MEPRLGGYYRVDLKEFREEQLRKAPQGLSEDFEKDKTEKLNEQNAGSDG